MLFLFKSVSIIFKPIPEVWRGLPSIYDIFRHVLSRKVPRWPLCRVLRFSRLVSFFQNFKKLFLSTSERGSDRPFWWLAEKAHVRRETANQLRFTPTPTRSVNEDRERIFWEDITRDRVKTPAALKDLLIWDIRRDVWYDYLFFWLVQILCILIVIPFFVPKMSLFGYVEDFGKK